MSNSFLKVTVEKNWRSIFGELQLTEISLNFKTSCCNLKNRGLGAKCMWLFCFFRFEKNYDVVESEFMHFVEQKYKL